MELSNLTKTVLAIVAGLLIVLLFAWLFTRQNNHNLHFSRTEVKTDQKTVLNVPPRRMWGWGGWADTMIGYCGESSFQICATYYGNYFSQEQVLKAGGGTFLLQTNDDVVTAALHMTATQYFPDNKTSIYDMLNWCKGAIDKGYPIILGAFCNEPSGDPSFDHQVVIVGYDKAGHEYPATIYLNDTYNMSHWPLDCSLAPYHCDSIGAKCPTGAQGYAPGSPLYPAEPWPRCYVRRGDFSCSEDSQHAPYDIGIPNIVGVTDGPGPAQNAFLAVTGNVDPNGELYPCWLEMDSPMEPNWGVEDAIGAPPGPLACNVYMEKLTAGCRYSLLRFDNPADVPVGGGFIHAPYTLRVDFRAKGGQHKIHIMNDPLRYPFMSNGTYFFRCVKNTAPPKINWPYGTNRTDTALGPAPTKSADAFADIQRARASLSPEQQAVAAAVRGGRPAPALTSDQLNNRITTMVQSNKGLSTINPKRVGGVLSRMLREQGFIPPKDLSSYAAIQPKVDAKPKPVTCPTGPTVSAGIVCSTGPNDTGQIHPNWVLTYPAGTSDSYGAVTKLACLPITLTAQLPEATAKNCVSFTIASSADSTFEDDGDAGCIGLDGKMYFEDFGDPYLYLFSPDNMDPTGQYVMLSQDGVTYATLRPV